MLGEPNQWRKWDGSGVQIEGRSRREVVVTGGTPEGWACRRPRSRGPEEDARYLWRSRDDWGEFACDS